MTPSPSTYPSLPSASEGNKKLYVEGKKATKIALLPGDYPDSAWLANSPGDPHTASGHLKVRAEGHKDKYSDMLGAYCDEVYGYVR